MDLKTIFNEGAIGVALVVVVVALVVVVIVSGDAALAATGLRDLAILLAGALAGTKVPKA